MRKNNKLKRTITFAACLLCISSAAAQNLISNGDFTAGNLSGWTSTAVAPTTITYEGTAGNPSGAALLARNNSAATANGNYLYQIIPVVNGAQYKLSAQWKGDLLNGGTGRNWAEVYINFTATNTTFVAGTIRYKKATDGGPNDTPMPWDWQDITTSPDSSNPGPTNGVFTATGDYMTIAFNLGGRAQTSNNTQPGYYWVDNVSVTPWPPTSAPVFTSARKSGGDIVLDGTNGPANGAYEMLQSAGLGTPAGSWQALGIRSFSGNGNFSFTNPVMTSDPAAFYRLRVVSSVPVFPPVITDQPDDLGVQAGENAIFNVAASGTTPLTYRWYFNTNTLLVSGSSASLSLTNAQTTSSGTISVTVSNLLGIAQSTFAILTVTNSTEPPRIAGQPGNQNVAVGQTANFSVTATGALPLHYQWYYNTNTVLLDATNSTLSLLNVTTNQAGDYSVTVTNLYGSTNSLFAALTVSSNAPPVAVANFGFETPTTANYIYNPSGASWTFDSGSGVTANNSSFTSGNPDAPEGLQVGFLKGLGTLSQTISGFERGVTYVITFAAANRGGGYSTPQTWDVRIDGVTQASFTNVPQSYADYTASFTATSASHLLTFIGRVNADATVFLDNVRIAYPSQPPGIVTQPASLTRSIGSTAQFSVLANGALPLSYQWYYSTNTVLTGQTSSTLTLNNVQPANAGKYSVTVTNVNGSVTSAFATLTVTADPPTITGQPANLGLAIGQSAEFSVTAIGALPLRYQWYYNTNTVLAGETNSLLTLFNVGTNQAGKYSVLVTNAYGIATSVIATLTVTNAPLAFPEAEGYGKYTVGGRGGAVYEVTSLSSGAGTGTLGAAIAASGARTVVFRVAGTITNNFSINNGNITIAGQTAPGDGICIKGNLSINANDVIIRYIRVRLDPVIEADAISSRYKKNIILDHVSASWSSDEVMSLYHGTNVTIQWCMITEGCAKFVDGVNTGHRFGGIWGNNYGTYHHNLIAHNDSRNIRWASGSQFNDYRNNVLYNWGYQSCYGGGAKQDGALTQFDHSTINMIANYYKYGPATAVRDRIAEPSEDNGFGSWFVADNYVNGYPTVTANNWLGIDGSSYIKLNAPWNAMPINQETPDVAYTNVLAHAGCSKPNRDSVDARIINEAATGTAAYGNNGIITFPSDVGGWPTLATGTPPTDTDHDGMPDAWETAHGLNPNNAADRNSYTLNPLYTNLEVYLNELGAF